MNVLVDTSVWVDHFRRHNAALASLLEADQVLCHPMVQLELACGTPPEPRTRTLDDLGRLRACRQASLQEVMHLIERERLHGLGCGLVDMALLASTLVTPGTLLWTLDKRLADLAGTFGAAYKT